MSDVPTHLRDHNYCKKEEISAVKAEDSGNLQPCSEGPLCRNDQCDELIHLRDDDYCMWKEISALKIEDAGNLQPCSEGPLCRNDQGDVPTHLRDHDYCKKEEISAVKAEDAGNLQPCSEGPLCRNDQCDVLTHLRDHDYCMREEIPAVKAEDAGNLQPCGEGPLCRNDQCDVPTHLRDHDYFRKEEIAIVKTEDLENPQPCSEGPLCMNDQCDVLTHLRDHDYCRREEIAAVKTEDAGNRECCSNDQGDVPTHLRDHDYCKKEEISAVKAEDAGNLQPCSEGPLCRNDQVQSLTQRSQHSAATARLPQKRKWSSVSCASRPSAELPENLGSIKRPRSAIPPDDLPAVSNVAHSPRPSSSNDQLSSAGVTPVSPIKIFKHSVEDYQQIFHEEAADTLWYKNGRVRPYTVELGRCMKQKLWERLDRPVITASVDEDGVVHVCVSYGAGVYPPLHFIDTSGEPRATQNKKMMKKESSKKRN